MKEKICPSCAQSMKRNGQTSAGSQRWRCKSCGASTVHTNDVSGRELDAFIGWLVSKDVQSDMPGQGRTFRRKAEKFWGLWPLPDVVDEVHRVVYVDGIYLARDIVVLIACSDEHVLSWYLARAETTRAWKALLSRIAPPDMVVSDGGSGFASAVRAQWPYTRVQRCLFHAFCQVKRCTTSHPRLLPGQELYRLSQELLHIENTDQAEWWVEKFLHWCELWNDFLSERTRINGRWEYTHERLRKARRGLVTLVNKDVLFTYLDPVLNAQGPMPRTNNRIEGGVNAQLRALLRNHRGLSLTRRIKAVYWWCYMNTEHPKSATQILRSMPTDTDIDLLYKIYATPSKHTDKPALWGDGLVWEELHFKTPYPHATN